MNNLNIKLLVITLLLLSSFVSKASGQNQGGIVYGNDWAFIVAAPEGWYMNTKTGLPVSTAFLQLKPNIPPSTKIPPAFMYITLSTKNANDPDINSLIKHDIEAFTKTSPNLKISSHKPIRTGDKRPAKTQSFKNTKDGRFELVAYQDYDKKMYKFVISASSDKELMQQTNSFKKMVNSFSNVKDGVKFEK